MFIEQIKFIETTQFEYQINFVYKGQNLQTENIPRSALAADIVPILRDMVSAFDIKRADDNFDLLRKQFEGQSVEI